MDLEGKLKKPSSSKRPPGGGPAPGGGPSPPASGRVANENVTPQPEANVRQKVAGAGHPPPTASPETVRRTVASRARGRRTPAQTPGPSTPRTGRANSAPTATPPPSSRARRRAGPGFSANAPSDTRTAGTRGIASIERRINTVDNSQTVTITGEIDLRLTELRRRTTTRRRCGGFSARSTACPITRALTCGVRASATRPPPE